MPDTPKDLSEFLNRLNPDTLRKYYENLGDGQYERILAIEAVRNVNSSHIEDIRLLLDKYDLREETEDILRSHLDYLLLNSCYDEALEFSRALLTQDDISRATGEYFRYYMNSSPEYTEKNINMEDLSADDKRLGAMSGFIHYAKNDKYDAAFRLADKYSLSDDDIRLALSRTLAIEFIDSYDYIIDIDEFRKRERVCDIFTDDDVRDALLEYLPRHLQRSSLDRIIPALERYPLPEKELNPIAEESYDHLMSIEMYECALEVAEYFNMEHGLKLKAAQSRVDYLISYATAENKYLDEAIPLIETYGLDGGPEITYIRDILNSEPVLPRDIQ